DLAPLPAAQHQIPVHVELIPGDDFLDLLDHPLLVQHEHIHGSQVVLTGGVVNHHVGNFPIFQLQCQVDDLLAVAHTGLGHHGDVLAALDMGSQDLVQVNVGQNRGVDHHHQLIVSAVFQ